jgi:hypothetical protein
MNKLRKVQVQSNKYLNGGSAGKEYDGEAKFHGWGVEFEEFGDVGVGNFTVAIVELPDGTIYRALPDDIKFIND